MKKVKTLTELIQIASTGGTAQWKSKSHKGSHIARDYEITITYGPFSGQISNTLARFFYHEGVAFIDHNSYGGIKTKARQMGMQTGGFRHLMKEDTPNTTWIERLRHNGLLPYNRIYNLTPHTFKKY